ncbi:hypothetical protein MY1884_000452 [Beauveria asiatica]
MNHPPAADLPGLLARRQAVAGQVRAWSPHIRVAARGIPGFSRPDAYGR